MSLLDGGTDILDVYPSVNVQDSAGNWVQKPTDEAIQIVGRMQPVSGETDAVNGQWAHTVYRFITRDIPPVAWGRVDWAGRSWDVVGDPLRRHGSQRTQHVTVLLRARGPEVT